MRSTTPFSSDHRLAHIAHYWSQCLHLSGPQPTAAITSRLTACYRHAGFEAPRHRICLGSPLAAAVAATWLHDYLHPEASEIHDLIYDLNKLPLSECHEWVDEQLNATARETIDRALPKSLTQVSQEHVAEFVQRAIWRDALQAYLGRPVPEWHRLLSQANEALRPALPGLASLDLPGEPINPDAVVEAATQAGVGHLAAAELARLEAAGALIGPSTHFWAILPLRQMAAVCSHYWLFDEMALAAHLPRELHLDDQGRPHCELGPAIVYADGWMLWAWHGVRVSATTILAPDHLTMADVAREPCPEARQVMLARMKTDAPELLQPTLRPIDATGEGVLFQADWAEGDWQRHAGAYRLFFQHQAHPDAARRHYLREVGTSCANVPEALDWLNR